MDLIIDKFSRVAGRYQGFIIDLWGVVHNGEKAFPHSVEVMANLKAMGKKICLLSNAPSRVSFLHKHLARLNVKDYDFVMSSGEMVWQELHTGKSPEFAALGKNCFMIGGIAGPSLLAGLDINDCPSLGEADFVWAAQMPEGDYTALLKQMREMNLPLICGNPDMQVLFDQKLVLCPGALAQEYRAMGGQVIYRGKPYPHVYKACLDFCGTDNLAAIGDGMMTDILGAHNAGLDSYFISSGIHGNELNHAGRAGVDADKLQAFLAGFAYAPTATMLELTW